MTKKKLKFCALIILTMLLSAALTWVGIPFFLDAGNKKLVFWFVRVDDEGYPEIARCTEREFATILAGISAGGMYCQECGTVHWPDGVTPPF
ncbi:hypothetical protein AAGW29_005123 [Escherichia coli]|nr:hypothetical protein [Escherichia coli]EEZ7457355.1 hypothetical protein [Escherichia coli]EKJ5351662.1 hypothetical protein [Escherichia coli]HAL6521231.1 hypothetical protein [Escherichia coli]